METFSGLINLGAVAPNLSLTSSGIEDLKTALASGIYAEYAKIDLKNFYPSIPHSLINATIRKKTRKPSVSR